MTEPIKVLEKTSLDNPEGVFDCSFITNYGNISLTEYSCDLQLEEGIIFSSYNLHEVKAVLKVLYPQGNWESNTYSYEDNGIGCSIHIITSDEEVHVSFGCSC